MNFSQDCKIKLWKGNDTEKEWCQIYFSMTGEDIYQDLRSSILYKIASLFIWFLGHFVGTPFYLCLIHYERFGQDPMKRTLKNRLIIFNCFVMMFIQNIIQPIGCFGIVFFPLSPFFAMTFSYLTCVSSMLFLLSCSQLVLLENVMLFKNALYCCINEDFFYQFLVIWNLGFAIGSQSILSLFMGHFLVEEYQLLTGNLVKQIPFPIFWMILIFTSGSIIVIGSVTKKIKTFIEAKKDINVVQEIHIGIGDPTSKIYNNQSHNPPLLSGAQTKIISLLTVLIFFFLFFGRFLEDLFIQFQLFVYVVFCTIFGLFLPLSFYLTKKPFYNHIHLSLMTPNCNSSLE